MYDSLDDALSRRLVELETRIAYQDDTLIKLEESVSLHQRQLYQLENKFETLLERFRHLTDNRDNAQIPNEKPPHY